MGTNILIITGEGEPFLHPRLLDIISAAKEAGLNVTLLTNGTLLDETRIQSLIDSGLDVLRVSLWAGSPEEYEKNYPGTNPTNFKKIIKGLRILAHLKAERKSTIPAVVLHQVINRHNFKKIDTMIDLANTTRCNTLSLSPLKSLQGRLSSFTLSPDEEKLLHFSLTRIRKQLDSLSINHNIDQTLLRYRIGEAVWKKLPCYVAWLHARIKVDGTVIPCNNPCNLSMGNLKENRFHEIWNGSAYRTFRRKTLTRRDLTLMGKYCDCGFCCHVEDNMRVHRLFRWPSPFVRLLRN
jgi:MoaA/NifB/PqqE/SkfB family radical SAM enzyme